MDILNFSLKHGLSLMFWITDWKAQSPVQELVVPWRRFISCLWALAWKNCSMVRPITEMKNTYNGPCYHQKFLLVEQLCNGCIISWNHWMEGLLLLVASWHFPNWALLRISEIIWLFNLILLLMLTVGVVNKEWFACLVMHLFILFLLSFYSS